MSELDPVVGGGDGWIQTLPLYQRTSVEQLLGQGKSPEEVAQLWLSTPGFSNTSPYGSQRFAAVFYDKLLEELEQLICDDPKYAEDRKRILQQAAAAKTVIVASIATVIAPHLGVSAVLIVPSIALILHVTSGMGTNAWCAARKELRAAAQPPPAPG